MFVSLDDTSTEWPQDEPVGTSGDLADEAEYVDVAAMYPKPDFPDTMGAELSVPAGLTISELSVDGVLLDASKGSVYVLDVRAAWSEPDVSEEMPARLSAEDVEADEIREHDHTEAMLKIGQEEHLTETTEVSDWKHQQEFEEKHDVFEEKLDDFKEKHDDFEEKPDDFEEKNDGFEEKLEDFEEKHNDFEEKHDDFEEKLEDFEEKHDDFEKKLDDFEEKHDGFEEKLEDFEEKHDDFEEKLEDFEDKHDDFEEKLEDFEEKHVDFEEKHDDFEEKHDAFEQKHDDLEQKHDGYQEKRDAFEKKHDDFEEEHDGFEENFEEKLDDFEEKLDDFEEKHDDFEEKHDDFEENQEDFKENFENKSDDCKVKHDDFEEKRDDIKEKNDSFEKKNDSFEEKHDDIEEKHDDIEEKHDDIEEKHDDIEEKHGDIEEKHDDIEEKHDDFQKHDDLKKKHNNEDYSDFIEAEKGLWESGTGIQEAGKSQDLNLQEAKESLDYDLQESEDYIQVGDGFLEHNLEKSEKSLDLEYLQEDDDSLKVAKSLQDSETGIQEKESSDHNPQDANEPLEHDLQEVKDGFQGREELLEHNLEKTEKNLQETTSFAQQDVQETEKSLHDALDKVNQTCQPDAHDVQQTFQPDLQAVEESSHNLDEIKEILTICEDFNEDSSIQYQSDVLEAEKSTQITNNKIVSDDQLTPICPADIVDSLSITQTDSKDISDESAICGIDFLTSTNKCDRGDVLCETGYLRGLTAGITHTTAKVVHDFVKEIISTSLVIVNRLEEEPVVSIIENTDPEKNSVSYGQSEINYIEIEASGDHEINLNQSAMSEESNLEEGGVINDDEHSSEVYEEWHNLEGCEVSEDQPALLGRGDSVDESFQDWVENTADDQGLKNTHEDPQIVVKNTHEDSHIVVDNANVGDSARSIDNATIDTDGTDSYGSPKHQRNVDDTPYQLPCDEEGNVVQLHASFEHVDDNAVSSECVNSTVSSSSDAVSSINPVEDDNVDVPTTS